MFGSKAAHCAGKADQSGENVGTSWVNCRTDQESRDTATTHEHDCGLLTPRTSPR